MSKRALQTAGSERRAVGHLAAKTGPERGVAVLCPPWCANGPHEDAGVRAWHDGEATVLHEVYLLRHETAEVVLEQRAHLSSSRQTSRLMAPALYVHIEEEICSAETADRLATALIAAARLMSQVAGRSDAPGLPN